MSCAYFKTAFRALDIAPTLVVPVLFVVALSWKVPTMSTGESLVLTKASEDIRCLFDFQDVLSLRSQFWSSTAQKFF